MPSISNYGKCNGAVVDTIVCAVEIARAEKSVNWINEDKNGLSM